ncbi:dynamin family protein [Candidatus Accumulibacter vicinus]|uniref:Elongation factor G n=1 Tax=Candidatus Accumulibacter vicinus TaxID=2954382 RepID=A0A084Y093_9PROT|nr:dynamin family protein [Candidatus Accumulibacter vicinus]KFB68137.1 MAG: elongation factor G [Candidatus Accumulibacter vicinus]
MSVPDELSAAAVERSSSLHSYHDYARLLIRAVFALSALQRQARSLALAEEETRLAETIARLEQGVFTIAVVGEFKRGKSTLINALLGTAALPMDVLPTTAALTRVVYGRNAEATLVWRDGNRERIPLAALADYVTKSDPVAQERARAIGEAIVAYPTLFCQNNVNIVDTPGLSDERAMSEMALGILPTADAAVMVISALTPFAQSEATFLGQLLDHLDANRLFFVVTYIDKLRSQAERERVLGEIRRRLVATLEAAQSYPESGTPLRLFAISAYQALRGKESHDSAVYAASCFADLETALEQYLARDRGAATLTQVTRVISESTSHQIAELNAAVERAHSRESGEAQRFERRQAELSAVVAAIDERVGGVAARTGLGSQRVREILARRRQEILSAAERAIATVQLSDEHLADQEARAAVIRQALAGAVHPLIERLGGELTAVVTDWSRNEDEAIRLIGRRLDTALADRETNGEVLPVAFVAPPERPEAGATLPLAQQSVSALAAFSRAFRDSFQPTGGLLAEPALGAAGWALTNDTVQGSWRTMRGWLTKDGSAKADNQLREKREQVRASLRRAYIGETREQIGKLFVALELESKALAAISALGNGVGATLARESAHVGKVVEWRRVELRIERERRRTANLLHLRSLTEMQSETRQIAERAAADAHLLAMAFAVDPAATITPDAVDSFSHGDQT